MYFFNRFSLKQQFYFIASILMSICILLTYFINYTLKNLLINQQLASTQTTLLKLEAELNTLYERTLMIYDFLQLECNLENIFLEPFTSQMLTQFQEYQKSYSTLSIMNNELSDIALIGNGIYYSDLFNRQALDTLASECEPYPTVQSLGLMKSSFKGKNTTLYCVFSKNIYSFTTKNSYGKKLGSLILAMDPSKAIVLPNTMQELNTSFLLMDKNFTLYPLYGDMPLTEDLDPLLTHLSRTPTDDYLEISTPNYIFSIAYLPHMQYYLVSTLHKNTIASHLQSTHQLTNMVLFIILLFVSMMMLLLFQHIIKPLNQLYGFIKSIGEGDRKKLKQPIVLNGSKEISTLSYEFNRMLIEINTLNTQLFETTKRLYEIELSKTQAEIAHLRSQINPHFLYNTLESIRGMAIEHHLFPIADMCLNMGKIFRYSIKGASTVPLSEEITIVKAYLAIQSVRFESRFETLYALSSDTYPLPVPKMILQPLIENALFHGIEPHQQKGLLYLGSLILKDQGLKIIIQDNGVGICETTLSTLQDLLNHFEDPKYDQPQHLGILNVHKRIRLLYGKPYGVQIESQVGMGTKITLLLPINIV